MRRSRSPWVLQEARRNFLLKTATFGAFAATLLQSTSAPAMITGDARRHVFRNCLGLRIRIPLERDELRRAVPEGIRFRGHRRKKYDVKARRWGQPEWLHNAGSNYLTLHTVALQRVEPTPASFAETWAWIPIHLDLGSGSLPAANWVPMEWTSGAAPDTGATAPAWPKRNGVSKVSRDGNDIEVSLHNPQGELAFSAATALKSTEQYDYREYTMWSLTSDSPTRLTDSIHELPLFIQEAHFTFHEKRFGVPGTGKIQITDADPFLSSLGLSGMNASDVSQWQGGRFDLTIDAAAPIDRTNIVDPMAMDS